MLFLLNDNAKAVLLDRSRERTHRRDKLGQTRDTYVQEVHAGVGGREFQGGADST